MHPRPDLEGFFPASVEFEWQAVRMPGGEETTVAERACVAKAVPKRQREFLTGRAAARLALARLEIHGHDLLVGPARSPLWPQGIVGSITHSDSFCLAVVAHSKFLSGIGVDCEPDAALEEPLWDRICTPPELEWIRLEPTGLRGRFVRSVFCAKEAVYKFQHPLSQAFLGFHDLAIRFNPPQESFSIRLNPQSFSPARGASPGQDPAWLLRTARGSLRRSAGQLISLVYGPAAAAREGN